jgi:hypothetical protein
LLEQGCGRQIHQRIKTPVAINYAGATAQNDLSRVAFAPDFEAPAERISTDISATAATLDETPGPGSRS